MVSCRIALACADQGRNYTLCADSGAPSALLRPAPDDWLRAYPVDKRVGKVANDDAALLEPVVA